jgi:hypothetical protein
MQMFTPCIAKDREEKFGPTDLWPTSYQRPTDLGIVFYWNV